MSGKSGVDSVRWLPLCALVLATGACGSPIDEAVEAALAKKPTAAGFRDVHVDDIGQVWGKAIDQQGRVDRFLWLDGSVTLESEMDAVTNKEGAEFAGLGASLKRGFLRQYEDCVAAGS